MLISALAALAIARPAGHPVEFSYVDRSAKRVQIAGDFNAWGPPYDLSQTGNRWTRSFELPDNGRIEYKLVVDGNWILDPSNPRKMINGLGGGNSVWEGPRYRSVVHDDTPRSPLTRSTLSVGGRTIVVFAPAQAQGLPILVYGDGPTYEEPGKIENIVENLVEAHRIRPVVLALVPPIDRMREYGAEWKAYGHYLLEDVLPAVRTATGASARAQDLFIGGSSMGGVIALRLAEEFPERVAGGIHCQSAAIQWAAMSLNYDAIATRSALARIAPTTRIWLDWGEFEDALTRANVDLSKTLRTMHRAFGSRTTPEGHNWTAWRNRMESGLVYLLGR